MGRHCACCCPAENISARRRRRVDTCARARARSSSRVRSLVRRSVFRRKTVAYCPLLVASFSFFALLSPSILPARYAGTGRHLARRSKFFSRTELRKIVFVDGRCLFVIGFYITFKPHVTRPRPPPPFSFSLICVAILHARLVSTVIILSVLTIVIIVLKKNEVTFVLPVFYGTVYGSIVYGTRRGTSCTCFFQVKSYSPTC